jgi:hypothetical protein
MKNRDYGFYGIIIALSVLFIIASVIFKVYEPGILSVQFFGALTGVFITVIITAFLLRGQTEGDEKREKNVKEFKQKIQTYSEFIRKMWAMFDDDNVTDKELKALRTECFQRLVFYLGSKQIREMAGEIERIRDSDDSDAATIAAGRITHILRQSLYHINKNEQMNDKKGDLITLFNSFVKKEPAEEGASGPPIKNGISYWHFSMLDVALQIRAFEQWNKSDEAWALALIEYGQVWRTNLIKQVKPNDVIFLLKRGGSGYIGAFRVTNPPCEILDAEKVRDYSSRHREKYDIYEGLSDGATLCSNILVKPIAYNCKGVECYAVIPKTIERIRNMESVKFLLNRFNGKDLDKERLAGKGTFDDGTPVKIDENYFSEIIRLNNL